MQQFTDHRGEPLWSSPGLPGGTHDLTAIRATGLLPTLDWITSHGVVCSPTRATRASGTACTPRTSVVLLADKGNQGIGHGVHTPYKGRELTEPYRAANRSSAVARSIGERGFAIEKNWRILRRYRTNTHRIGPLVPGVLGLGATSLVVESCSQDVQDSQVIGEVLAERGMIGKVRFDVVPAPADELLWAADVIAWAYGAGGAHHAAVAKLVTVHRLP